MRAFLFFAVLILLLLTLDAVASRGRYSQAAWQETTYQGEKWYYEIRYWLRKTGR
jgi:hypothetical protein